MAPWLLRWVRFFVYSGFKLVSLERRDLISFVFFIWKFKTQNLRYLTAAVVLSINSRKRKSIERDLVKVIEQEEYAYKDPVTEFILWWVFLFAKFIKHLPPLSNSEFSFKNNCIDTSINIKSRSFNLRWQTLNIFFSWVDCATQLTTIDFNVFSLYVKFDFRKAQEMLEKCTTVLENDFFLRNYTEQVRGHFY